MIMGQVDEEGIQSIRQRNMKAMLIELCQYSRGTAHEPNNRIRIVRKMELTQIEETQSDATISIPNHMLKQASRKLEGRKSKTLVVCLNLSYLECVWLVFVARVISAVVRKKGPHRPPLSCLRRSGCHGVRLGRFRFLPSCEFLDVFKE